MKGMDTLLVPRTYIIRCACAVSVAFRPIHVVCV